MQLKAFVHYDCALDVFDVVAWLEDQGAVVTVGLDSMSAQLYDKDGTALSYTVSGVTADAVGLYNFTQVENPDFIENGKTYVLRLETQYAVQEVSTFVAFRITNIN
jgi:hypothetical protein